MYRILLCCCFPLLLAGQRAEVPLVMYAVGEVAYDSPASAAPIPVHTGTYLTGSGTLSVRGEAVVEVARGDQFMRLDRPGKYAVGELFTEQPASAGFIDRFLNFVRRGLEQSASSDNLEKAYLENQGNAQGNIEGYGDGGLAGLMPFGGTLSPELTTFSWPADGSAGGYRLRIVDSLSEAVVLSALTRDTTLRTDLGGLKLTDGQAYYWEVFPNTRTDAGPARLGVRPPAVVGTRIYFTYREQRVDSLLQPLAELEVYNATASAAQRRLLEAMTFEEQQYLYAADRAYRLGLTAEPRNPLLVRSYAAFLSRWNQRSQARALLTTLER